MLKYDKVMRGFDYLPGTFIPSSTLEQLNPKPRTMWTGGLKETKKAVPNPARKVTKEKGPNKESCVYFIRNTLNGLVKIGRTTSIPRRLQTLQTAVGDSKLIVENKILVTPNRAKTLEKNIHLIFEKQRRSGEWFDVNSKSIEVFIRVLRSVY